MAQRPDFTGWLTAGSDWTVRDLPSLVFLGTAGNTHSVVKDQTRHRGRGPPGRHSTFAIRKTPHPASRKSVQSTSFYSPLQSGIGTGLKAVYGPVERCNRWRPRRRVSRPRSSSTTTPARRFSSDAAVPESFLIFEIRRACLPLYLLCARTIPCNFFPFHGSNLLVALPVQATRGAVVRVRPTRGRASS